MDSLYIYLHKHLGMELGGFKSVVPIHFSLMGEYLHEDSIVPTCYSLIGPEGAQKVGDL